MLKKIFILNLILSLSFLGYRNYEKQKYWIFFKDKGFSTITIQDKLLNFKKNLPEKVLRRRLKTLQPDKIIDISDLPLYQHYLNKLQALQIKPIVKSKWLNATSVQTGYNMSQSQGNSTTVNLTSVTSIATPDLQYNIYNLDVMPSSGYAVGYWADDILVGGYY